jgi:hypothetical protein
VAVGLDLWFGDHMSQQRGADSAAISGAVYYAMTQTAGETLPSQNPCTTLSSALTCASHVAILNNTPTDPANPPSFVSLTYPGLVTALQVTVKDPNVQTFMGVAPTIGATATAGLFAPTAETNVPPIAVDSNTASCWTTGQQVTLTFEKTSGFASGCTTNGGFVFIDILNTICNNGLSQTATCIDSGCGTTCTVTVGSTATHDTGNKWHNHMICGPNGAWSSLVGQTIILPVFSDNPSFVITGFVSFLVGSSFDCGNPNNPSSGFITGTYEGNVSPPVTGGTPSGSQNYGTYEIALVK